MNYLISALTDIGLTKDTNQDAYSIRAYKSSIGSVVFAILCDGMGGLSRGEVASATVVAAFNRWADNELAGLIKKGLTENSIRNDWGRLVTEYNQKIKAYGSQCGVSLGTTLTAILLTDSRYYIINVGDTRAYEIAGDLAVLTKDQTLVSREVELGRLTPEQAETDPRRSVLLQCIGASETVVPEFVFGDVKLNAVYMLCSDGFRHEITEDEIYEKLSPYSFNDVDQLRQNMQILIDRNKERQERDNITVVSIKTF